MKKLFITAILAATSITSAMAQENKFGKIVDNGYTKYGYDLEGHLRVKWVYIPGDPTIPNSKLQLVQTWVYDENGTLTILRGKQCNE